MKGHWKDECPTRDRQSGAEANVITIDEGIIAAEIVENLPAEHMATWEARTGDRLSIPGCHLSIL